ncbi:MAG: RNA 2',3'-cyclic phosphodiesterase [Solirubrobacteraceae bacterium]
MRLFLAINLPAEVRREVEAATATLRDCAPEISWISAPRLHLTLKFLDEQPAERVDEIRDAIAGVAGRHRELLIALGGIGAFPNFRRARVVWMGVMQEPRLELLHHDLEVACEQLGFEVEGRTFRPHLTLARVKQALPEERLRSLSRAAKQTDYRTDFVVRSIDLMNSALGPSGPTYTTLVSAALRS